MTDKIDIAAIEQRFALWEQWSYLPAPELAATRADMRALLDHVAALEEKLHLLTATTQRIQVGKNMKNAAKDMPGLLPVGLRCFYRNEALHLEGWGEIVEPADDLDAEELDILVPWRGTLAGPDSAGQHALNVLAPGCGVTPGEGVYRVLPRILLWVPNHD